VQEVAVFFSQAVPLGNWHDSRSADDIFSADVMSLTHPYISYSAILMA
jgi:hypothetical protein